MDRNKKHTLPLAVIPAVFSLLLAGGCDNRVYDGMDTDIPAREVSLNFNASIEKTESVQTKSFTPIDEFPAGTELFFGMSVTKVENGSGAFAGSSDMKAKLSFHRDQWSFYDNSIPASSDKLTPVGPEGKELKVIAYYPFDASFQNVYTEGIPFDFSVKERDSFRQSDLLYNTAISCTPLGDPTTVPLNFRHAYTWIVLNITKYVDKSTEMENPVKLSAVSLDNLKGGWIKNKGTIDPETGLVMDNAKATAGPIGVTIASPVILSTNNAVTFEFLVPSFMDPQLSDGEIVIVLKVNEIDELFTLDKSYLNQSDDKKSFGFRQGYKNTYNLVYNNSALSLNVQSWSSVVIDGGFGGTIKPIPNTDAYTVYIENAVADPQNKWPYRDKILANPYPALPAVSVDTLLYRDYLTTVAYGGNGIDYTSVNPPTETPPEEGVRITDDLNVQKEEVFAQIDMTKNDLSVSPVPWEDANGKLVAKEICRNYKGGGHTDWRLPRASELRAVFAMMTRDDNLLENLQFKKDVNLNKLYWTGTEESVSQAWSIYYDDKGGSSLTSKYIVLSPLDKKMTASVRCVRNVPSK